MTTFSDKEKIAILKVLHDILLADNIIRDCEIEYLERIADNFGIQGHKEAIETLEIFEALDIIKRFSKKQKEETTKLMGKMIVIDKDINYNEVRMYNTICEECDFFSIFNIEEYSEYSISGIL